MGVRTFTKNGRIWIVPTLVMLALTLVIAGAWQVNKAEAAHGADLLMLSTTLDGLGSGASVEEQQAIAAGLTYEIATPAQWAAKSASDFSHYRALVLGDPHCGGIGSIAAATANAATWGPEFTGNVIIIGTDPDWHGHGVANPRRLVTKQGMEFAASDPGKTGAYITLSCYYHGVGNFTAVPMLDTAFGISGDFTVRGVGCFNVVKIVATHPALTGITDAILGGWSCSVHEAFDKWPISFEVLAIATLGTIFTAPDGTLGTPYILAGGVTVISDIDLIPHADTNNVGETHTVTAVVTDDSGGTPAPVVGLQGHSRSACGHHRH